MFDDQYGLSGPRIVYLCVSLSLNVIGIKNVHNPGIPIKTANGNTVWQSECYFALNTVYLS